ncbi:MAG: discoidin domain-containing protein, partial [Muribaculaceae bacterium]|nr:discoidin domain-containing protein [Muribaculaceae bacterium]
AMVMLLSLLPTAAFAAGEQTALENIALGAATTASSEQVMEDNGTVDTNSAHAVDGRTKASRGNQWSSEDMKSGTAPGQNQDPQWLCVDLGTEYTYPISIDHIKLYYNARIWPQQYRIETSATGAEGTWETLVSVIRSPYDGGVKNGDGQNIADETGNSAPATAANTDTITKTSTPGLAADAAVERYVRVYIEKVNTLAPGNNVSLVELQIFAPVQPLTGTVRNLALGRGEYTKASSTESEDGIVDGAAKAVDGNTTPGSGNQWSSGAMKTAATTADDDQNPHQWLWVDLGASGTRVDSIKLYYNRMVWPMVYEIQTTNDDPDGDDPLWVPIVRVERDPFNGGVKNGAGQDIADETGNGDAQHATNTDTITLSSAPALQTSRLGRYVRFYVEKVNTEAGGHNVCLVEIEINGVNSAIHDPVDVSALLNSATASTVTVSGSAVTLPAAPEGGVLTVAGSSLENVVANDGTIGGKNIQDKDVALLIRAWEVGKESDYQQKNLTLTVPANKSAYPANWFPAVTNPNPKPEVIPALQEWQGGEGSFTLTKDSRIIYNDPANVGLSKVAANMKADLKEITGLDLKVQSAASATAKDIFIQSQPADVYDLRDEGYVMRVSGDGVQIYAPTYTGCLYGTITAEQILWQAEDHLSIPNGVTRDYPAYAVRGLKIDVGRAPTRYQFLEDYAKIMLWYKMSEYDLHINDTENPNASNATDSQNNIGFHRLESDTFPSLKLMDGVKKAGVDEDLVDAGYYNSADGYGGNPVYTKQQWKDLTQLAKDYGMRLLTEIDMPGHALAYNKYVEKYPEEAAAAGVNGPIRSTDTTNFRSIELLDLTGPNATNALKFAKALWNEYTSDGTITGDVVHIGMDEYWLDSTAIRNAFAQFADQLRQVIQKNLGADTKIRMWGATNGKFSTATTALNTTSAELAKTYQLELWDSGVDNAVQRVREGYEVVNCEQSAMYSCPGRHQRDVPNAEYLFNSWDPTMFGNNGAQRLLYGEPNLLGAKAVMWGEQTQEGLTERDIHQRLLRAVAIVSEKTWTGTQQSEGTFEDYELRAARLAEGPGTAIAMTVPSETSLVLDYDFTNVSADGATVYDASGNGYNATLTGGSVEDGWLTFDGATALKTPLTTLSYPYTVSFDLIAGEGNDEGSSLFSGYDGRIQVAGHNGNMSANAVSFIRDLGYAVPTGTQVNITLVGTFQATRLYANGELMAFLSQTGNTFQDGVASGAISSYFSSIPLPLETIGKGLHGAMANLKVYNKAMTAGEVAALQDNTDDGLVNVAQSAVAGGSSFHSGDGFDGRDNAYQRTSIAQKAVDGEEEEMYSFWQGDHSDSALTVDLGQTRSISQVDLTWMSGGVASAFKLQTSANGVTWTDAKTISGNSAQNQTVTLDSPVEARFLRLQLTAGTCKLAELKAYEQVTKDDLAAALAEAEPVAEEKELTFQTAGKGTAKEKALFSALT